MIGTERGFSDFPKVLWSILFLVLEDIWLSFARHTNLQNFRSCFKKFQANLPLPSGFNCSPFCQRCSTLMLLLSMHSDSKFSRCLLSFRIARFDFHNHVVWWVLIKRFYSWAVVSRCLFLASVNCPPCNVISSYVQDHIIWFLFGDWHDLMIKILNSCTREMKNFNVTIFLW